ncbi:MAG: HlyC/CorC family transporter [Synergistaceae bacterium]|nr:HlyC/CorC family transporter [Synergistaceae bacterium]
MSSDISGSIILLVVLLILSIYFSATETSITAAGKGKLLALSDEYLHRRKDFLWLVDNTAKAINVTLIGNNLVNIAASAVATTLALKLFGALGPVLAVAIMTVLIVVFCEILPKNFAIAKKERVLLFSLPLLRLISSIMTPVTWSLRAVLRFFGKIAGMDLVSYSSLISRQEIDHIVSEGSAAGALEEDERKMIHGVIAFEETRVSEVMEPRTDVHAIEQDGTVAEAVKIFFESGHSRIPVYREDLDQVIGILYAKDLLVPLARSDKNISVQKLMRKPLFVPETMKTDEALDTMKKSRTHIAIVIDEYGGMAGLITLEDLIEEIVGDIQDEYDTEIPEIQVEDENTYLIQGQVNLEELSDALAYPFDTAFEDVDTLAGMVLELSGDFPTQDQLVTYGSWDIHVLEVHNHRILQVRMKYIKERTEGPLSD